MDIFILCCTENLGLTQPSYFYYLNQSGTYQVDGTDDSKEFEATMVGTVVCSIVVVLYVFTRLPLFLNYYYYYTLSTASFQDNLSKPVPER